MDIDSDNINFGLKNFSHPGLKLIQGDILKDMPESPFDIIVMSNVLEHIEDRIGFMRKVQEKYKPNRWLIRVPLYERDWRVPLMDEIGVDSRLDGTHYIEYSRENFIEELNQVGLTPVFMDIRWGEIWCEVKQK